MIYQMQDMMKDPAKKAQFERASEAVRKAL